jgi:hypothetical protein
MKLAGPMQTTGEAIYTDDEVGRHCMTLLECGHRRSFNYYPSPLTQSVSYSLPVELIV